MCSLLGTSVGTYFGFPLYFFLFADNALELKSMDKQTLQIHPIHTKVLNLGPPWWSIFFLLSCSLFRSYQTILHQQNKSVKDFFVSKQYTCHPHCLYSSIGTFSMVSQLFVVFALALDSPLFSLTTSGPTISIFLIWNQNTQTLILYIIILLISHSLGTNWKSLSWSK